MVEPSVQIFLCRHGETTWTISGQHTGTTDLPLTDAGKKQVIRLKERLKTLQFNAVFSSPLRRALETCHLAGLTPTIDKDLSEWHYGEFEGLTHEEIYKKKRDWSIFKDGAPGGESPQEVSKRADRVLQKLLHQKGNAVLFSHGHFLRALTARFLELEIAKGALLYLSPASFSTLGFERTQRVIKLWNELS